MSIPADSRTDSGSNGKAGVKTLAIRLEPDQHAHLSLIAQLRGSTITDEIRTAIEAHIALAKATPELAAGASDALEDIEREAALRRAAIATLFGTGTTTTEPNDETDGATPATTTPAPASTRKSTQR